MIRSRVRSECQYRAARIFLSLLLTIVCRYANMDYLFVSTLVGVAVLILLISYNIACQWSVNLVKRMADFPIDMWLDLGRTTLRYAIPKKHYRVHGPNHSRYSLNVNPGIGRTYGEGIESHWGHMNPVTLSAREMSPSVRHKHLNDHWGAWNWQKIKRFADQTMFVHQGCTSSGPSTRLARCMPSRSELSKSTARPSTATFSHSGQTGSRPGKQIRRSRTPTRNQLRVRHVNHLRWPVLTNVSTEISQNAIRRQLAEEEAAEKTTGMLPVHETTPSVFLQVGLELEEQQ